MLIVVAVVCQPLPVRADAELGQDLVTPQTTRAIRRGTKFLVSLQRPDGSWPSDAGKKINERYSRFPKGSDVSHVGVTSLAALALLAGGHLPGRGPYGKAMERAIDFIAAQVRDSGYITANGTRMYSHAFATLALAEVYGQTNDASIHRKLQEAVQFTIKSQNQTGGWRYVPQTNDSDMSVTVCQVVALRAARNVGIKVPRRTIDRALRYVLGSAVAGPRGPTGAFYYQPQDQHAHNRDSFALCAAGLTTLFQAGLYDNRMLRTKAKELGVSPRSVPDIQASVAFMRDRYRRIHGRYGGPDHYFYYYGNYYAAQAMYQVGGKHPSVWRSWYRMVRDDLLEMQRSRRASGTGEREYFWKSNVDDTHAYATASALLILQFPLDHLPIHQR